MPSLYHVAHFVLVAQTNSAPVVHQSKVTFFQAIVLGLLQGVTELFPVSSLGHTVVFPALFGWHNLVASESKPESFWLAFVVALHVGTALALVGFFWREWMSIIGGLLHSAANSNGHDADRAARMAPRRGDDPGRHHGTRPRASTSCAVHKTTCRVDLPRGQRLHPLRRRGRPPPRRDP